MSNIIRLESGKSYDLFELIQKVSEGFDVQFGGVDN